MRLVMNVDGVHRPSNHSFGEYPDCRSYAIASPMMEDPIPDHSECDAATFTDEDGPALAIVIPSVKGSIGSMEKTLQQWTTPGLLPCDYEGSTSKPGLIFISNQAWLEEEYQRLLTMLTSIRHCFTDVLFQHAKIAKDDDVYDVNGWDARGPNLLFLSLWDDGGLELLFTHFFWYEIDVYPVRSNWIDVFYGQISAAPELWMSGPLYMESDYYFDVGYPQFTHRLHINGNSLYALRNPCMRRLVQSQLMSAPSTVDHKFVRLKEALPRLHLAWDMYLIYLFGGSAARYNQRYLPASWITNVWRKLHDSDQLREDLPNLALVHGAFTNNVRNPEANNLVIVQQATHCNGTTVQLELGADCRNLPSVISLVFWSPAKVTAVNLTSHFEPRRAVPYAWTQDTASGYQRVQLQHTCPKSNVVTIDLHMTAITCPVVKVSTDQAMGAQIKVSTRETTENPVPKFHSLATFTPTPTITPTPVDPDPSPSPATSRQGARGRRWRVRHRSGSPRDPHEVRGEGAGAER